MRGGKSGQGITDRGSFQSDFTNEMGRSYQTDRVGNNGHPVLCFLKLPSMAIFPWDFDHFISEITDCTQQQKTPAPYPLFLARFSCPFPGCFGSLWLLSASMPIKIDFPAEAFSPFISKGYMLYYKMNFWTTIGKGGNHGESGYL